MDTSLKLEKAKELVASLEQGDEQRANLLIADLTRERDTNLFKEIGKLTRELHEALTNFQLDSRISGLAAQEIPDAKERLQYVINLTEDAANKTMDTVEQCLPIAEGICLRSKELLVDWEKLFNKQLQAGEFRVLCEDVKKYLQESEENAASLNKLLNEVFLAQNYQDLTGQVIRRIMQMIHDVEESLVGMIKMFGAVADYNKAKEEKKTTTESEGPIVNPNERTDVVNGQDEVDDLLSSLGF